MLINVINHLLIMSLVAGGLYVLLGLADVLSPKRIPATWRYPLGLFCYSFFLVPYAAMAMLLPLGPTAAIHPYATAPPVGTDTAAGPLANFVTLLLALTPYVLVLGATFFLTAALLDGYRLKRSILAACRETTEDGTIKVLRGCTRQLGIRQNVRVYTAPYRGTPFICGHIEPRIVLPDVEFTDQQLEYIFLHELTHLKRGDLWIRSLIVFVNALHWFNPLAYLARGRVERLCELSCDESVTASMQQQEKQAYCALIVDILQHSSHGEHALPTPFAFSNSRKYFEERIDVVMQKRTGRASKMTLAVAGTLTLLVTILAVVVSYAAQANLVVLKSPPSGGYVYGTADAAQLETLNRLRHTETTFDALIAAVFPKAHARIPADALQFIHTATVDWPSEDAPPRPRTFTISGPE